MFFKKYKINKALKKMENDIDVREELKDVLQKFKLKNLFYVSEIFNDLVDSSESLSEIKDKGLFSFYKKNLPNEYNAQNLEVLSKNFENYSNSFSWQKSLAYKNLNITLSLVSEFCVVIDISKMNVELIHPILLSENHLKIVDYNEISSIEKIHKETTPFAFEFMKYVSNRITEDEFLNEVIKLSIQKYK